MNKNFLKKYLNAYSPSSQEVEGQKIWAKYISDYVDELSDDNYGTVWGIVKRDKYEFPVEYKVVIEAHCDEISWMISNITEDGKIYVNRNGGSDAQIAPSKRVVIHTRKNGLIPAVFGWPALHIRTKKETPPELKNIFVDTGYDSKKEVLKQGIEVGNIITFNDQFEEMGNYYTGRSVDNKIGGYIIAEVARKLKENNIKLPYDLYIVNAVQEETGLHGARMVAQTIKPDVAIITDVCHNTHTPMVDKHMDGDIDGGCGGVIAYSSQNHRKLIEIIRNASDKAKISYQLQVGSQGNDTMGFFTANGGIPTAIIATPLKYMHTTVEMAHKKDVESVINMFYHTLQNIKNGENFKYHNF